MKAKVGACLWAKNKRGIKDEEAMNLMCEGTIRVENDGLFDYYFLPPPSLCDITTYL